MQNLSKKQAFKQIIIILYAEKQFGVKDYKWSPRNGFYWR
jgi:hypothetical protein